MSAFLVGILAAIVAIFAALRIRRTAYRVEESARRRHPVGADGVIPGAQAITLRAPGSDAGRPAVLLLHGGGDTPQTLSYLARHLYEAGYDVEVPLLPGHGRDPSQFAAVHVDDWLAAARAAYDTLRASHRWTAVVGLSMGGALAAALAADDEQLGALVLLAPYLAMPRLIEGAAIAAPMWRPFVPFVNAIDATAAPSIQDPVERERNLAYGVFTPNALRALRTAMRRGLAALSHIHAPTLVMQSRADNRVTMASAQRAFERLGAVRKRLVLLEEGSHVITVDRGREMVLATVRQWLDDARASPGRAGADPGRISPVA